MSDEEVEVKDPTAAALAGLPKLTVRQCDLPEHLFTKVKLVLKTALDSHKMEKDIAREIKTKLDEDPEFNELPGKITVLNSLYNYSLLKEICWIKFFFNR